MKKNTVSKLSVSKIVTLAVIVFFSFGWMTVEAQTKKVVMVNFIFSQLLSQETTDDPTVLPYGSKSTLISISIDVCEDYEKMQKGLKERNRLKWGSARGSLISSEWVIEGGADNKNIFSGILKNNSGVGLTVTMEYPKGDKTSEKNVIKMFGSFKTNAIVKPPVVINEPPTSPANTIPPVSQTINSSSSQSINSINIQEILAAHNTLRNEKGVLSLTWSADLAAIAQAWANDLASRNCGSEHSGNTYGENISRGSANHTLSTLVQLWGDEKKDFNPKSRKCIPGRICEHYTQVIWKNSTEVGCGLAKCSNGNLILVCNYNPSGNLNDEPAY